MNKTLIFDIGGVLVKLGGMSKFVKWTGLEPDMVKLRWLSSKAVRDFEAGRIPYQSFASAVIKDFNIPLNEDELLSEMKNWAGELFDDAHELLAELSNHHQLTCLCNTNEIHWPLVRDNLGLGQWFQRQFISHEIGMVKPDKEIYIHVNNELDVLPENIYFFDDSLPNIENANEAGWNAYHVNGVKELRVQLSQLNFL